MVRFWRQFRAAAAVSLALQSIDFERNIDPLRQESTEPFVISQLLPDLRQFRFPHEARAALAAPGITQLIIGTVLDGRIGRAATTGRAADAVLLREGART